MEAIINEIYQKMHVFVLGHYGKSPNWIYMNHDSFYKLKALADYYKYLEMASDPTERQPKSIMGMNYRISEEYKEITVQ